MTKVCPICNSVSEDTVNQCLTCGFRFIETTQQFKPISVDVEPSPEPQDSLCATLAVIRGPQTGIIYLLEKQVSSLGRSPQCDIFLNDMTVSREHALIARTEKGYVITDRNSFNGLWVNNSECSTKTLADGDIIQLGVFCLRFNA